MTYFENDSEKQKSDQLMSNIGFTSLTGGNCLAARWQKRLKNFPATPASFPLFSSQSLVRDESKRTSMAS